MGAFADDIPRICPLDCRAAESVWSSLEALQTRARSAASLARDAPTKQEAIIGPLFLPLRSGPPRTRFGHLTSRGSRCRQLVDLRSPWCSSEHVEVTQQEKQTTFSCPNFFVPPGVGRTAGITPPWARHADARQGRREPRPRHGSGPLPCWTPRALLLREWLHDLRASSVKYEAWQPTWGMLRTRRVSRCCTASAGVARHSKRISPWTTARTNEARDKPLCSCRPMRHAETTGPSDNAEG